MKSRNSTIGLGTKSDLGVDAGGDASVGDSRSEISNDGAKGGARGGATDGATDGTTIDTKKRTTDEEGRRVTDQPADDHELPGDFSEDFSEEELRDFLAADFLEVQADPSFREGLRRKLWTLVSDRYGRGPVRKN